MCTYDVCVIGNFPCLVTLVNLYHPGYIAGFTDPEVSNRPDLYDVYVNLADSEITVSQLVKGGLVAVCLWDAFIGLHYYSSIEPHI